VGIEFQSRLQHAKILDPKTGYGETTLTLETRWDPLTKRSVRVLDLPIKKLATMDIDDILKRAEDIPCPFCPDALDEVTPRFPNDFIEGGRLCFGEVCVIPNRLPFDRYCAVVVLTHQHYVPLADFTEEQLFNGFSTACVFLRRLLEVDSSVRFFSINWNYLPMSGGSIIHPHLQIIGGDLPTHYQGEMIRGAREYRQSSERSFWDELITKEKELGERYIGAVGNTVWLASYAPFGLGDTMTVFRERTSLVDLTDQDLRDFIQGLLKVFRYYQEFNYYSFNLSLYSGEYGGDDAFWVNARILARRLLPPVGASDASYFEKLHGESIAYKRPERQCEEMQGYF
jgi:UDPglucose--hexose-1-phosphate uridylyltransferase